MSFARVVDDKMEYVRTSVRSIMAHVLRGGENDKASFEETGRAIARDVISFATCERESEAQCKLGEIRTALCKFSKLYSDVLIQSFRAFERGAGNVRTQWRSGLEVMMGELIEAHFSWPRLVTFFLTVVHVIRETTDEELKGTLVAGFPDFFACYASTCLHSSIEKAGGWVSYVTYIMY